MILLPLKEYTAINAPEPPCDRGKRPIASAESKLRQSVTRHSTMGGGHRNSRICDSAEAMGTVYRVAGRSGALMLYIPSTATRSLRTSSGGALTSADEKLIRRALSCNTGRERLVHYEHVELAKLSSIKYSCRYWQGSTKGLPDKGRPQATNLSTVRRWIGRPAWHQLHAGSFVRSSHRWLSVITIDAAQFGADFETVRRRSKPQYESRPVWNRCTPTGVQWRKDNRRRCRRQLLRSGLCLPSGSNMSQSDQDRVIEMCAVCQTRLAFLRQRPSPLLSFAAIRIMSEGIKIARELRLRTR